MYNKTYFKVSDYLDMSAIRQSNIDIVKRDTIQLFFLEYHLRLQILTIENICTVLVFQCLINSLTNIQ